MTTQSNTTCTHEAAPHPRSRLRVRIVLAGFAAVGLAALARAAFVSPLPRLTQPSDSVAVGWYRIEPFDPRTASLPSAVRGQHRCCAATRQTAMLAAQRGYLPTRVPAAQTCGRGRAQHVCIVAGQVRIDGVPAAAALLADRLGRPLPSRSGFAAASNRASCSC